MLSHLTLALLAATGATPRPVKIASPGLSGVNLPDQLVGFYSEQLAEHLRDNGIEVVTGREMTALMGLERQRQLLGCAEEATNCLAELANALGVDGLLMGDVARLGQRIQLSVKVLSAQEGRLLAAYAGSAEREDAVLDLLATAGQTMGPELLKVLKRAPANTGRSTGVVRRWAWLPAAAAVASAGAGTWFALQASGSYGRLAQGPGPIGTGEEAQLVREGNEAQLRSRIGFGVAAAGLVAAGAMYLLGGPSTSSVRAAVHVSPEGGGALVSWRFP